MDGWVGVKAVFRIAYSNNYNLSTRVQTINIIYFAKEERNYTANGHMLNFCAQKSGAGWADGGAGLRIAYSDQKRILYYSLNRGFKRLNRLAALLYRHLLVAVFSYFSFPCVVLFQFKTN